MISRCSWMAVSYNLRGCSKSFMFISNCCELVWTCIGIYLPIVEASESSVVGRVRHAWKKVTRQRTMRTWCREEWEYMVASGVWKCFEWRGLDCFFYCCVAGYEPSVREIPPSFKKWHATSPYDFWSKPSSDCIEAVSFRHLRFLWCTAVAHTTLCYFLFSNCKVSWI